MLQKKLLKQKPLKQKQTLFQMEMMGQQYHHQEQTDDAFTAGTDTAAALPDETPSIADATDAVGAAVVKAEDWVSTENGFKLRKPAKNQDTANTDDQKAATAALPDEEMLSETDGFSGDQTESSETAVAETDTTAVTAEVTAMETPAATDTVSVTNEEFLYSGRRNCKDQHRV